MPGLLDIAPPEIVTERFDIRGGFIEVRGLRNREWAKLLRRFPELRQQMNGAEPDVIDQIEGMEAIMPAVIAAGLGACGDEETEALIIERLTEAEQAAAFGAVMRLMSPPSPLAGSPAVAGQDSGNAATTSTQPQSSS